MLVLNSPQIVQEKALRWKKESKIAFVPTMGCLHEGHEQLVRRALQFAEKVIVSIFVNPLQFGPNEDYERYPRTMDADEARLEALGVDLLFSPTERELYPKHFSTRVTVDHLTKHLCGKTRPGHFEGVATVCLKLFQITQPDFAVFGEKDFQQLRIIQQMVHDLNLPLTILPEKTVRDTDGLALSSRNRYLSPEARQSAAALPKALFRAAERAEQEGELTVGALQSEARQTLAAAGLDVDYLEIASERDLVPAEGEVRLSDLPEARIFAAVRLGETRLIDNVPLHSEPHEKTP